MTLEQVAQRLAVECDDVSVPRHIVAEILSRILTEDHHASFGLDPYQILARLDLPVYLTTNYDDLLGQAVAQRHRGATREHCLWSRRLQQDLAALRRQRALDPSAERPLVFHLHGHIQEPQSIVVSEDDFLDFVVNLAQDLPTARMNRMILPLPVRNAFRDSMLLFLGYRLADINFRVIHRGIVGPLRGEKSFNVTVQLPPNDEDEEQQRTSQSYLEAYFGTRDPRIHVYWGTATAFLAELEERLQRAESFGGAP